MKDQMKIIRKKDPVYPERLRVYDRMPDLLYVLGELPDPQTKSVAIVGARACSAYGRKEALRFAGELARHGVQIISGMAKGIDSWAHIGALENGGRTFAVLGCGADVCYPPSHDVLYRQILENGGGILSEYESGTPARPHHFPMRNRIISGLADAVLVVEARKKSGSLITASYALEQGKSIYAVPGKNGDALSEGCNLLLADGASVAWGPETILQELGLWEEEKDTKKAGSELPDEWNDDPAMQKVWQALDRDEKTLEDLCAETGLPVRELTDRLIRLCLSGFAEELPGRRYIRK